MTTDCPEVDQPRRNLRHHLHLVHALRVVDRRTPPTSYQGHSPRSPRQQATSSLGSRRVVRAPLQLRYWRHSCPSFPEQLPLRACPVRAAPPSSKDSPQHEDHFVRPAAENTSDRLRLV